MLTQTQIDQFQRDGFLNGGGLLNDAEVEELRAEVMRVIDQREPTFPSPSLCAT
jgi:phytanoyl-CoA hydroxylase